MSYVIRYYGNTPKEMMHKRRSGIWICMGVFLAGVGAAKLLCPELDYALQQFLFPGGGMQTMAMLEEAAMRIQQGDGLAKAIHAFCVDVISNASY